MSERDPTHSGSILDVELMALLSRYAVQQRPLPPHAVSILRSALADRPEQPVAYLETTKQGEVIGVSLQYDPTSPHDWEPLYAAPVARPEPAQPVAQEIGRTYLALESALGGIDATLFPQARAALVTHCRALYARQFYAAPSSLLAPSEVARALDWTKCQRCTCAVYIKKDPQCPRCGWDTREAINGNV